MTNQLPASVRVGVIGCGHQGQAHLERLAAIEGVELAAIADLEPARLDQVGDRFAVAQRYRDPADLLAQGLDLVSICTMPNTHRELALGAFENGSDVLCEKPLALNADDGAVMVRAAREVGRLLMVGFNMRYMGASSAIRRFADEGLLGDLICARGFMFADEVPWWGKHYRREISGGGALNASAVHMIDLLMWLAGFPQPLTATASATTIFPRKRANGAPSGAAAEYDVEDLLFGHVRCAGGFWFTIESAWTYDRLGWDYSFDAHGTRGQAHLSPLELYTERDGRPVRVREDLPEGPDFDGGLDPELRGVIESVRRGVAVEPLATGEQALVVQAIVDALYRSAEAGAEVPVEVPVA